MATQPFDTVGRLRRLVPDSMFGRLALLLLAVLVGSHIITFTVLFELDALPPHLRHLTHGLPPDMPPPPGHRPPGLPLGVLLNIVLPASALLMAAWFGARWLLVPLQRLSDAAQTLGSNIASAPLPEQGTRECRNAIRALNHMQARIQAQMEQRDQFLAAVSHDLRTPLTRLTLRTQSLEGDQERGRFAKDIAEMEQMIASTLQYFQGTNDPEPLQTLDVASLVSSCVADFQDSGQPVSMEGDTHTGITARVQPQAMRRCLDNLITNALRYGQWARVALEPTGQTVQITIQDGGPGIPQDMLENVMQPFVRMEPSRNRNSGGVGLGLAIAKNIVSHHGGTLTLHNTPGQGLRVCIGLPV